jgi:hypothetical protein
MHPTNRKKLFIGIVLVAFLLFALFSIPTPDPPIEKGVAGKPFTWKQDITWDALEVSFRQARGLNCNGFKEPMDRDFRQSRRSLATLAALQFRPDATIFTELEKNIFRLAALVAACPERLQDYIDLVM